MTEMPTDTELSSLARLGDDLYDAETEVLRLEAELGRAKKVRNAIREEEIPEAMKEIGVLEFRTPTCKIALKEILRVQPLVANRPLVLKAVEAAGQGALIKSTVTVAFGRGDGEKAKGLLASLQEKGLQSKQDRLIAPSTLKKYVRDLLEAGEPLDQKLFGVYQAQEAKFSDGAPQPPVFEGE